MASVNTRELFSIGSTHMTAEAAREFLLKLMRQVQPNFEFKDPRPTCEFVMGDFRLNFIEAIQRVRSTGTHQSLRAMLYLDPYFPITIGMSGGAPGLKMTINNFNGESTTTGGLMRNMAIENEFTSDILWHRRGAQEHSSQADGFARCAMHYRGYVLSCAAIVEMFLYRTVSVELKRQTSPSDQLQELGVAKGGFEYRLELWLREFCERPLDSVKGTKFWNAFSELRTTRNELLHPSKTQIGLEMNDVARRLNLVRDGIGGFVNHLRHLQGCPPVSFAETLETAPMIKFEKRHR